MRGSNTPGWGSCLGQFCHLPTGENCTGYCDKEPGRFVCVGHCKTPDGHEYYGYGSYGEPHMRTADGEALDFQAAGEYLIVRSGDGSIVLQARQEPARASSDVTYATAVAAGVSGDRVAVTLIGVDLAVSVNGAPLSGLDVSMRLPNGGIVERHGTVVTVDWPDGSHLSTQRFNRTLSYGFTPGPKNAPLLRGLLGGQDGDPSNDLTGRDGVVLERLDPDFFTKLHNQFGDSWRITQAESLFDYLSGQSTATFTLPDYPRAPATIDDLDPEIRAQAEALCRAVGVTAQPGLADCTLDVGLTGDPRTRPRRQRWPPVLVSPLPRYAMASSAPLASDSPSRVRSSSRMCVTTTPSRAAPGKSSTSMAPGHVSTSSGACWGPRAATSCRPVHATTSAGRRCRWPAPTPSRSTRTGPPRGDYAFTLSAVPPATVSSISIGADVTGSISLGIGEWHHYTFAGSAGQIVYLDGTGACIDLQWRLLGPEGRNLVQAGACNDIGRQTLPVAGTYTIEVYSDGTATGDYAFTLSAVPPATVSSISIGADVTGSISRNGEWHHYTFAGSAGQIVYLDGTGACIDLQWRLLGPEGRNLVQAGACNDIGRQTLPVAGTYTIEVYSDGTATGDYAFTLSAVPPGS